MSEYSVIQKEGVRKIQINSSVFLISTETKRNYFNLLWWGFRLHKIDIFQLRVCFTVWKKYSRDLQELDETVTPLQRCTNESWPK